MAALWFDTVDVWFYTPVHKISRWKDVMALRMERSRFTDVAVRHNEVVGRREGGWTSLVPLLKYVKEPASEYYVMVIMCGADTLDVAKANVADVRAMMGWNDGLWQ